jgi:hypothetical protein
MKVTELRALVGENSIFTVDFIKKDGTLRTMNCRLGVTRHLKGGELGYNAAKKNLLPVFDMVKGAYRMINVSTIIEIRFNKQVIKVDEE